MPDAIVVGAGPNGLVAANLLADAGLDVLVLEEQATPGGAVRSEELTVPGYTHDVFSAFYPFAAASPAIQRLDLEEHGLRWCHAPAVVGHPDEDGGAAILSRDLDTTCASLDAYAAGDGDAWRELLALWERIADPFMQAFVTPVPPVLGALKVAAALGHPREIGRFARMGTLPVRRFGEEHFAGVGGTHLIAGNALHADLTPDSTAGGLFGLILCMMGQTVGFPVPEGGAGRLAEAMVDRFTARGGNLRCGAHVTKVLVRGGRAVGVRLADGEEIGAPAVLADVGAPQLFLDLVGPEHLPDRLLGDLKTRFQYDNATVKVDWALDGPVPWSVASVGDAGTVHLTSGMEALTAATTDLEQGIIPEEPFLILGQYSRADPTRQPPGHETMWAYTHVPRKPNPTRPDRAGELTGSWQRDELERFADRMEGIVEDHAPGFRARIVGRHLLGPREMQQRDRNLVWGAINGGTAKISQQLVFRPTPGTGRPETPVRGLYLASASAHPGGGVHGGPGHIAARAHLAHRRARRFTLALGAAGAAVAGATAAKRLT